MLLDPPRVLCFWLLAAASGCTLVSGWSDLQTGLSAASNVDAAPAVDTTIACGAARCDADAGCCAGRTSACVASAQACTGPSLYITCSDARACTAIYGYPVQCCALIAGAGLPSVKCQTTCGAGEQVVCDPTGPASDCPPGQSCQLSSLGFGYSTCQ